MFNNLINIEKQITTLCDVAVMHNANGQFKEAIDAYQQGLDLLPEPKTDWNAFTLLHIGLGESYAYLGAYKQVIIAFQQAFLGPKALHTDDMPWIHLRLGQAHYELGHIEEAKQQLTLAYMGGGREIFVDKEDAKYFEFLKTFLRPPLGETWDETPAWKNKVKGFFLHLFK